MKKILGIILVSLLSFNLSIADENEELKLIEDYKEKLLESGSKRDLKQVEKICSKYQDDKAKNIVADSEILSFLCSGGVSMLITSEYNDMLLDKSISHIDKCNEYKKIPIEVGEYDQMSLNTHIGIMNYCETVELRANFKQDAKHNLIKDLDLEKLNFNFLSNKYYSLSIPEKDITKKASCFLNLKEEKSLDYKDIKERCGVESVTYQEESPAGSEGELASYELISESDLTRNWIVILDYFYADANEDGYMDLVIRFKNDGSYSMAVQTMTTVITSLSANNYKILNSNTSNASFDWIKNQTEYTDANQLFFDSEKRFLKLIESNVSSKSFPPFTGTEGTLIEKFKRILGGPPNEVVYYEDRRYVVTSSCEARACPVKAFVFIDTKEKYIIGLIREWDGELYIFSQAHKLYSDLPEIFFRSVIEWSKKFDIKSTQVFFIGSDEILRQAE